MPINEIIQGSALENLEKLEADSIDLIVTDPPYGYSFMNKDWDKAVVPTDTWRECLRVLKPGAFAFIMSSPRQDVFCKMMLNLIDAGFRTDFSSIYWAYASGFPKAADVSKLVDKRNGKGYNPEFREYLNQKRLEKGLGFNDINRYLGYSTKGGNFASDLLGDKLNHRFLLPSLDIYRKLKTFLDLDNRFDELIEKEEAEREIIAKDGRTAKESIFNTGIQKEWDITKPATEQAKQLEGSYAGFQPKPAVELILVVMKPLSEKSYVDQALDNQKGITWLDDCRIPYQNDADIEQLKKDTGRVEGISMLPPEKGWNQNNMIRNAYELDKGRFPANILVEDDVLNDGKNYKTGDITPYLRKQTNNTIPDYNRFVKADNMTKSHSGDEGSFSRYFSLDAWAKTLPFLLVPKPAKSEKGEFNKHPTVKSLKLMSYLITMGSREGDTVLDPFCGSGTVLIAAHELHRQYLGIEISSEYCEIARERLRPHKEQKRMQEFA